MDKNNQIPDGTMIQAMTDIKKGQFAYAKNGMLYLIDENKKDVNVGVGE